MRRGPLFYLQRLRKLQPQRQLPGHWGRTILLSVVVGVLAGLTALLLEMALHWGSDLLIDRFASPGGGEILRFRWELLLLPALGGLFSGLVVQGIAGLAPGHGTDQFVAAFHHGDGAMQLRAPVVKAVASVGVISAGGSAGPEGPIVALGAALGSSIGRLFDLTARDRRVLLISGCAAAIGALFGCPLGGALFANSVLYRQPEFESTALVSAFIASAVGYASYVPFGGHGIRVLSGTAGLAFESPAELPLYVLLGAACGLTAIFFSISLRGVERRVAAWSAVPGWMRPALGGLAAGALACALPQVIGGRYQFVQNVFSGDLLSGVDSSASWLGWSLLLAAVALTKCVATALTVGSGAAGGVLGPSVFIGGCVGASLAALCEALLPGFLPPDVRMALIPVGMAGVLSASMRTPLAAMVMVMEMTGSYGLIVPLMLVTMISYLLGRGWGLIEDQVRSTAESPAHAGDALVNLLERYRVGDVLERDDFAHARRSTSLQELLSRLRPGDCSTVPVLEGQRLVGLIALAELRQQLGGDEPPAAVIAADLMRERPLRLVASHTLYEGLSALQEQGLDALPVVVGNGDDSLVGMLRRSDVYAVVRRYVESMRRSVLREHAGLAAIGSESQLSHLLSVMPAPDAGRVERLPVDDALLGRSLADLDFRNAMGSEVIAIQTREHLFLCPPDPRRPLEAGDGLLVMRSATPDGGPDGVR